MAHRSDNCGHRHHPNHTSQGILVIASSYSKTGYISVGNLKLQDRWLRYLRCDHSLLGGVWLEGTPGSPAVEANIAHAESIYTTFHLQQAVRLVEREGFNTPKALIIGLGIGTVVQGLEAHGINCTIVEIDPMVYSYAVKYFGLTDTGPVILQDARQYLRDSNETFEYIVHDIFTGGAMPLQLLTAEAWHDVRRHLKPEGVVAIVSTPGTIPPFVKDRLLGLTAELCWKAVYPA
jgi:hypothetical protein